MVEPSHQWPFPMFEAFLEGAVWKATSKLCQIVC